MPIALHSNRSRPVAIVQSGGNHPVAVIPAKFVDAVGVKAWDLAAIQPIVEEAGGMFTDFSGVGRIDSGSAISSNGHLHAALLEAVA